jgi:hypothetical protein
MVAQPNCSFCCGKLKARKPIDRRPAFQCEQCKVIVLVFNQNFLPKALQEYYVDLVVRDRMLGQTWGTD